MVIDRTRMFQSPLLDGFACMPRDVALFRQPETAQEIKLHFNILEILI
jgi:hypothetical protein